MPDTLIRRPLDGFMTLVYRKQLVAGTIAHKSPLLGSKLDPGLDAAVRCSA